jgi:hypothetical protein
MPRDSFPRFPFGTAALSSASSIDEILWRLAEGPATTKNHESNEVENYQITYVNLVLSVLLNSTSYAGSASVECHLGSERH